VANNYGRYTIGNYVAPKAPLNVDVGMGWEYVRLINNSPYLLSVDIAGAGAFDLPEFYLEDIKLPQNFRGKIVITPSVNLSNASFTPSNLLSINAYQPGELAMPQSQPMTFLANVGNTINVVGGIAAQVVNQGNPAGSNLIQAQVTGDSGTSINVTNDGIFVIGDTAHPGSLTVVGPVTFDGTVAMNASVAGKTVNVDAQGNLTAGVTNPAGAHASNRLRAGGIGATRYDQAGKFHPQDAGRKADPFKPDRAN